MKKMKNLMAIIGILVCLYSVYNPSAIKGFIKNIQLEDIKSVAENITITLSDIAEKISERDWEKEE